MTNIMKRPLGQLHRECNRTGDTGITRVSPIPQYLYINKRYAPIDMGCATIGGYQLF